VEAGCTISVRSRQKPLWFGSLKRAGGSGPKPDDLLLIHSNINQVRELFETWKDAEAMGLLVKLEGACC
jgi:N(2)-fixation sustaining protein CowN